MNAGQLSNNENGKMIKKGGNTIVSHINTTSQVKKQTITNKKNN